MRWPWQQPKLETRNYSDARLLALLRETDGDAETAADTATAALESCAGLTGRGFMAAEVIADSPSVAAALTPAVLEMVGRQMILSGDVLFYLDTSEDDLTLIPASSHFVRGGPMPSQWTYDFSLAGPTSTLDFHEVPADSVLHFTYAPTPNAPWLGCGPITTAMLSGRLSGAVVRALGYEVAGPIGSVLGIPIDGDDPTVVALKRDLAAAKGGIALLETGSWDNEDDKRVDLAQKRYGPAPGAALVDLAQLASNEVYSACGYNPALFIAGPSASSREAYRMALFAVLSPLGKRVESELSRKVGPVEIQWSEMRAADVQARGRTVDALVKAGATLESASREVGFKNLVAAPTPEVADANAAA